MMKRNGILKKLFIGKTKIKISSATANDVILKITSHEHGFATLVKLTKEQLESIYTFIMSDGVVECYKTENLIIENIHAKHRECTKCANEDEFTYKYYESKDCQLQMITVGGHCILSLNDGSKHYRTISFRTHDVLDSIKKLRKGITYSMCESAMMKF